jgi:hypothetical protein
MAEVTMSLEEYNQLLVQAGLSPLGGDPKALMPRGAIRELAASGIGKKKKRVGKKDPKMSRALKKANSMGRKKNGSLKKGWSQGKIMKKAHQLRRRM